MERPRYCGIKPMLRDNFVKRGPPCSPCNCGSIRIAIVVCSVCLDWFRRCTGPPGEGRSASGPARSRNEKRRGARSGGGSGRPDRQHPGPGAVLDQRGAGGGSAIRTVELSQRSPVWFRSANGAAPCLHGVKARGHRGTSPCGARWNAVRICSSTQSFRNRTGNI